MKRLFYLWLAMCAFVLHISCDFSTKQEKPVEPEKTDTIKTPSTEIITVDSDVEEIEVMGLALQVQELNDSTYLHQGDILIDKNRLNIEPLEKGETPDPRKAAVRTTGLWPNNTVYYQLASTLSSVQKSDVAKVIDWFHKNTAIKFVNEANAGGYIYFVGGTGCSSYIGKTGRKQNITLGNVTGCGFGSTFHEVMHALGFFHEQARADRDQHIKIIWSNIQAGREHNFQTYGQQGFAGADLGNFDFGSLMMYGATSFSKAWPAPTITKLDGSSYTMNRTAPSAGDISAIKKLYPPKNVAPEYENGKNYILYGVTVYRMYDKWYYFSRNSNRWLEVELRDGRWYYL